MNDNKSTEQPSKNLEQLNQLAKEHSFADAHHAITCAKIYRDAYSEYMHKYNATKDVLIAIKPFLPKELNDLLDSRMKEL